MLRTSENSVNYDRLRELVLKKVNYKLENFLLVGRIATLFGRICNPPEQRQNNTQPRLVNKINNINKLKKTQRSAFILYITYYIIC